MHTHLWLLNKKASMIQHGNIRPRAALITRNKLFNSGKDVLLY